jgi:hypothetical protein
MKYLYIPTTTLNFNNILSTGSISPPSVYAARRFGYNKFEDVPPNSFQNVLLIYDRCPIFSIVDTDRDNHPLVIRIRADRLFDANRTIRDINVYDKTIYLDPASTEFLFDNFEAKKITMIKAEPSLTTKLISLFEPRMLVVDFAQLDSFTWSQEMLDNICDGPIEAALRNCELDARINRLKGFVCGYILGAYKALDEKTARFRSVNKEQRNEISAMLNDPSRGDQEKLRRSIESCTTLDELWAAEGVGRRRFEPEQDDRIVNDRGQLAALEYRHESDPHSSLLLIKLFNNYCLKCDFSGQLDESRFNVAMDGAKSIKNLMGSEWEDSPTQAYINDLLNNIKNGHPFDFNSPSSLVLKSFAAFVLKGDDLEKLEIFLVDQGIGDFRMAFALWGAMFGFSKIPKTVYNLPEFPYRKKMHNYVHSVVHGIPLRDIEYEVVARVATSMHLKVQSSKVQHTDPPTEWGVAFQQQLPGAVHWLPSLSELWAACGNIYDVFIAELDKAKSSSLGAKLKKGTKKTDIINFFKDISQIQPELSEQPFLLLDSDRQVKFCDDPQAWEIIRREVPDNLMLELKRDLEWFQKEWNAPDSSYYGKQSKSHIKDTPLEQRTNADAIHSLVNMLNRARRKRLEESREYLSESAIENIRNVLSDKYR